MVLGWQAATMVCRAFSLWVASLSEFTLDRSSCANQEMEETTAYISKPNTTAVNSL